MREESMKAKRYLHPIDTCEILFHTIHLDHLEPMNTTEKGYRYLLTAIDAFTKFVIYPTTLKEVIGRFENKKTIFGNPKRFITDRYRPFFHGVPRILKNTRKNILT